MGVSCLSLLVWKDLGSISCAALRVRCAGLGWRCG